MKRKIRNIFAAILVCCMTLVLFACGTSMKSLSGSYVSAKGTSIILREDGTCTYTQLSWDKSKDGTWTLEEGVVTVSGVFDYDIYAAIEDGTTSLLFKSDSSSWNEEVKC